MQKLQGWAEQGATQLTIVSAPGTIPRKVQGSYPGATVTVYITSPPPVSISAITRSANVVTATVPSGSGFVVGQNVQISGVADSSFNGIFLITATTSTTITWNQTGANTTSSGGTAQSDLRLATIYQDNSGTPKANPFVAGVDATWFAYVPNGTYDVRFSGAGITVPFTVGALSAFDESAMWIDVTAAPYLAGNGAADDSFALQAAIDAVPAQGGTVFMPGSRTYNLTGPITITRGNLKILAEDGAVLQYNGGATSYIIGDNGTTSNLYMNVQIDGLTIRGNANVQYGVKITSLHHSYFTHLRIQNVANTGMYVGFAVGNIYDVRVSNNDCPGGVFAVKPVCGIDLAGISDLAGATGSDCYFIVEGVSGSGIRMGFTDYMILRGFSESNNIGLETYTPGVTRNMSVIGMDFESNPTAAVLLNNCYYSNFFDCNANNLFNFNQGRGVTIYGGQFFDITIGILGFDAMLTGQLIYIGTLTDNQPDRTIKIGLIHYDIGSNSFSNYTRLAGDQFSLLNRDGINPTTGFVRASVAQAGADLLQFTDPTEAIVYGRINASGAYQCGENTKGFVRLQPSNNITNEGYIEFYIGATRYAFIGGDTAGNFNVHLENGAKFGINTGGGAGAYSRTLPYTSTFTVGLIASGAKVTTTFSVPAVVLGDVMMIAIDADLQGVEMQAYVSAPGVVTVIWRNNTGGNVSLGTPTIRLDIWQH